MDTSDLVKVEIRHGGIDYEALYRIAIRKSAFFRTALFVFWIWFLSFWIAEAVFGETAMLDSISYAILVSVFCGVICLRIGGLGIPLLWGNLTWKRSLVIGLVAAILDVLIVDGILYCRGGKEYLHFFAKNEFLLGNIIQSGNDMIAGPLLEEFLYRGYLQTLLQPITPVFSVVVTAAIFAFSHTNLPFPEAKFLVFLEYLPGSIILSLIRQRTKSIVSCILAHALYNVFIHFDPIKILISRNLLNF
jgi:membrane protease YdiL (CAAX protease family)